MEGAFLSGGGGRARSCLEGAGGGSGGTRARGRLILPWVPSHVASFSCITHFKNKYNPTKENYEGRKKDKKPAVSSDAKCYCVVFSSRYARVDLC